MKGLTMPKMVLLLATITAELVAFNSAFAEEVPTRDLVIFFCSRCHAADESYLSERSEKAWELTVDRMQSYYYTDEAFTDKEAERMVKYLAANPYSYETYRPRPRSTVAPVAEAKPTAKETSPAPEPGEPPDGQSASAKLSTEPEVAVVTLSIPTPGGLAIPKPSPGELAAKAKLQALKLKPKQPKATGPAKIMGYVATAVLALMVITGLMRRKMGSVFPKTHSVLAFIFCGSLAVHAVVFLAEYGIPNVLWFWFGIVATVLLMSSEFTGLLHLKNRKLFVKYHTAAGVVGLVLTAAHWAWIYI